MLATVNNTDAERYLRLQNRDADAKKKEDKLKAEKKEKKKQAVIREKKRIDSVGQALALAKEKYLYKVGHHAAL